jgi:hypothetical protein
MSFTIFSSYSFTEQYMFRPNRPSSGVPLVVVKESSAHCNAVFVPAVVVASDYLVMWVTFSFILVSLGYMTLLLVFA